MIEYDHNLILNKKLIFIRFFVKGSPEDILNFEILFISNGESLYAHRF